MDLETFIEKAKLKHDNKYDYSLVNYVNAKTKVSIICPVHGIFGQVAAYHLAGNACPKCGVGSLAISLKLTRQEYIDKARFVHGDKYDYTLVDYKNSRSKVKIICPIHGVFEKIATEHLQGKGCRLCKLKDRTHTKSTFVEKSRVVYEDKYDYSLVEYINSSTRVKIICPIHGIFEQKPVEHTRGYGCVKCSWDNTRTTQLDFVSRSLEIHKRKYTYDNVVYENSGSKVSIICPVHGVFEQRGCSHLEGKGCLRCSNEQQTSKAETDILDFLNNVGNSNLNIITSHRLPNNQELDIYLPDHNLAIEYNGLYYHSSYGNNLKNKKSTSYHRDKMLLCREADIELLQIFEDEWVNLIKQEIWKSIIKHKLGLTSNRVYARKCTIAELNSKTCSTFLEENHLMGKDSSPIRYGLTFNNKLVSVITFGKPSLSGGNRKYDFNIGRFSILKDTTVVGGFSKLLSHFLKLNPSKTLSTAADLRYSTGDVYTKNGFKLTHETKPNYWYWKGQRRFHRFGFRKQLLGKRLETFDPLLTEKQNMLNNKWNTIYDAGNAMFDLLKPQTFLD